MSVVFQLEDWWSVHISNDDDSEELDIGSMTIGNIDSSSPATNNIAIASVQGPLRFHNSSHPKYRVEDLKGWKKF